MESTPTPPEHTPNNAPAADDHAGTASGPEPGAAAGPGPGPGAGSAADRGNHADRETGARADRPDAQSDAVRSDAAAADGGPGTGSPTGPDADPKTDPKTGAKAGSGAPMPHGEIGGRKFRVGAGDTYIPNRVRAQRRRRKVMTIGVGLALVVAAAAYGVVSLVDPSHTSAAAAPCATQKPSAPAASQITVNVYNSTDRKGLAAATAAQLKARGFIIGQVTNDPLKSHLSQAAQVRGGTTDTAGMRVVAAEVPGTKYQPDTRPDHTVDLVLGTGFTALASPAQVTAALAAAPGSQSPGACHSAA